MTTKLTAEKLAKYEADVAGNERIGFTASRVDNADLLSLIAAARELEGVKSALAHIQAKDDGRWPANIDEIAGIAYAFGWKGPTK